MSTLNDYSAVVHSMVEIAQSEPLLRTALSLPALREKALTSPHIPSNLWFELYDKPKLSAKHAKVLCQRWLEPDQLMHVLATETRTAPLAAAVKCNELDRDALNALLDSPAASADLIRQVVSAYTRDLSPSWLAKAAQKFGTTARLEFWLRCPEQVSDEQISEQLRSYNEWGPAWPSAWLNPLLAERPAVLAAAADSDNLKVRTAAAGCRHLTDPALQRRVADLPGAPSPSLADRDWVEERSFVWTALVCNPATSLEVVKQVDPYLRRSDGEMSYQGADRLARNPYELTGPVEQVQDPMLIAWLLRRSLPNQSGKYRAHDLPAVLANPHLSVGDLIRVARAFRELWLCGGATSEALLRLFEAHPDVYAEHAGMSISLQEVREHLASPPPAPPAERPLREGQLSKPCGDVNAPTRDYIASQSVDRLAYVWSEAMCRYFETNVPDSPNAWLMLFTLLSSDTPVGTAADVVTVVTMTTA